MNKLFKQIGDWIIERIVKTSEHDQYYYIWLITFGIATTISAIVLAIGNPIGASLFSHTINIGKIVGTNGLLFFFFTFTIGALLSLIRIPLPRLLIGSLSYTICINIIILYSENSGKIFSYVIGISYGLLFLFLGLLWIIFTEKDVSQTTKITTFALMVVLLASFFTFEIREDAEVKPIIFNYTGPVLTEDPTLPGSYAPQFYTYGSGKDLHRKEFGTDVDEFAPSVDASHFITSWRKSRERFWGFNQENLPINGRVWMPEGKGPFPLLLITHGNHTMEYFSTAGYDYLGELLASRGIIAISIDQDFINYSNTYGIPNDNYKLRAWMFLKHLVHLQQKNNDPDSIFYQKIDFNRVALAGHSRGGQAAMMAADYETFFAEEDFLEKLNEIHIEGVIAISPTDNTVDNKKPRIHNTSYLLLHGARDADVYDFRGDLQYHRTTFDKHYDGFKSTVYIADANHTHFNSDWGSMDLSLPRGLFLNQKQTMSPESQQQLTKAFITAFLERIFHGKKDYEKLFQDYRYGRDWLPDTLYVTKYEHPTYESLVTFKRNTIESLKVEGFSKAEVLRPKNRRGQNRLKDALQLEWENQAIYQSDLPKESLRNKDYLVLTMANIDDIHLENRLDIRIELSTENGLSIQRSLDDFLPFPPVIVTNYTHFGLFDQLFREGRYERSWEPIFQTFIIPLADFEEIDPTFKRDQIKHVSLYFMSNTGKILIEEIGAYK